MAKRRNRTRRNSRDAPMTPKMAKRSVMLCSEQAWHELCVDGYRPISQCPEVQMCINAYARSVAMMTIHLMQSADNGDLRIKNELSRKVDITPAPHMGRTNLMYMLVRQMMAEGNAILYPEVRGGYLEWLRPLPPSQYQLVENGSSYIVRYNGKALHPDEVINLTYNPDPERPWKGQGVTVDVQEMVRCIRQANATKNALLESPAPSVIVKVDGYTDELKTPEGRRELAKQYADAQGSSIPWFVPADLFEVTTVKPLTLNDLAIKTSMELDKRAVAAIFGVPPFLVGVGTFNAGEFDWFVANKVMPIARIIEQELTRKLLISPRMYFRFNNRSLLNYNLQTVVSAGSAMVDRAAMRRNELRDWMGLPPDALMDDILILENYIRKNKLTKDLNGPDDSQTGGESDETGQTDQDTSQ